MSGRGRHLYALQSHGLKTRPHEEHVYIRGKTKAQERNGARAAPKMSHPSAPELRKPTHSQSVPTSRRSVGERAMGPLLRAGQ